MTRRRLLVGWLLATSRPRGSGDGLRVGAAALPSTFSVSYDHQSATVDDVAVDSRSHSVKMPCGWRRPLQRRRHARQLGYWQIEVIRSWPAATNRRLFKTYASLKNCNAHRVATSTRSTLVYLWRISDGKKAYIDITRNGPISYSMQTSICLCRRTFCAG